MKATEVHLHRDDCPETLGLLASVIRGGTLDGFRPTQEGAYVDWDELMSSYLSTTEKAAVLVARGLAMVEAHGGGWPPRIASDLVGAVERVAS